MTKEQQRDELHRTIWQIANDLRGSVDGWDFKAYVLGMLFYRFISENLTSYINKEEQRTGDKNFDYTKIKDSDAEFGRGDTVKEKGFYILPSELFVNVRQKAKNDANLNETLFKGRIKYQLTLMGLYFIKLIYKENTNIRKFFRQK
jgi:type I restriction enzyme M protein